MSKVRIKQVVPKPDPVKCPKEIAPILLKFQHGVTKHCPDADLNRLFKPLVYTSASGRDGGEGRRDFAHLSKGLQNGELSKQLEGPGRTLVSLESSRMTYVGFNNPKEELRSTYIGVRKGKKMHVYEVTPVTLSPFIPGHSHVLEGEREIRAKSKQERKEEAIDLVKSFGSKRKRLTYEKNEKHKIDVGDMNESMSTATGNMKAPEEEPVIRDESVLSLIPPCNRTVTDVRNVYNLDDLIAPDEMDQMEDLAVEVLSSDAETIKGWRTGKIYSDYFLYMCERLRKSGGGSDSRAIRNAKLAIYTELLISLLKLRHEDIRKKNLPLPPAFPQWLQDKALETFSTVNAKGMRTRSEALKDKTCCYVMVLVLLANDFIFDVQLMSTSLNIHIKKLLTLAKAVGITVLYNATTKEHRGSLKLPLPKPIETRGRRRTLR